MKKLMFILFVMLITCNTAFSQSSVAVVNSGGYAPIDTVSPNSIASAFGTNMSIKTEIASNLPLPTILADVSVLVGGDVAPLFFVSPNQVNFLIPSTISIGLDKEVFIKRSGTVTHIGKISVKQVVAGFFNQATANNLNVNSGYVTEYYTGGSKDYKFWQFSDSGAPIVSNIPEFKSNNNYYGVFYLTGASYSNFNLKFFQMKNALTGDRVTLPMEYSGQTFQFAGLDQINVKLNNSNGYLFPKGLYLCWAEWTNNGVDVFTSSNTFYIRY